MSLVQFVDQPASCSLLAFLARLPFLRIALLKNTVFLDWNTLSKSGSDLIAMRAFTFDFDVDDAPCSHSDIEEKEKEESYPSVRNLEIHQEEKGARVEWTSGSFDYAAIPFSLVRVPQSTSSADTEEHCVVDSKSIRFQVVDTSDPKVLEKAESMQTILISSDIKSGFYEGNQ